MVVGPEGASGRLDRVDLASLPFFVKYTEIVLPGFNINAAVSLFTKPGEEIGRTDAQECRDPVFLFFLKENAAFSIAAIPAHFAVECFHEKSLNKGCRFNVEFISQNSYVLKI